jgi:YHS domain-containing protein
VLRLFVLAALAVLIYLLLRATIAGFLAGLRGQVRRATSASPRQELVKDPVCETYVPRRSALVRTVGPVTYYFCSPACVAKFKAPS